MIKSTYFVVDTKDIIIDSEMSFEEALKQNPDLPAPEDIIGKQALFDVLYYGFDKKLHKGQIVVDKELEEEVKGAFDLMLQEKFPIKAVIPAAGRKYAWDDETLTVENISSGFNYRNIAKTERLSNHALGRAIDINPFLNPYFRTGIEIPDGSKYDPKEPGTIVAGSSIVEYFKSRGWTWGGDWTDRKDYMHFEK